jgi:hypothetical protein
MTPALVLLFDFSTSSICSRKFTTPPLLSGSIRILRSAQTPNGIGAFCIELLAFEFISNIFCMAPWYCPGPGVWSGSWVTGYLVVLELNDAGFWRPVAYCRFNNFSFMPVFYGASLVWLASETMCDPGVRCVSCLVPKVVDRTVGSIGMPVS